MSSASATTEALQGRAVETLGMRPPHRSRGSRREHGHGGSIALRCAGDYDPADIAAVLDAHPAAWRIEAVEAPESVAWEIIAEQQSSGLRVAG
jgi:hypothetical protein